ncbi:methyl-accepting chemotaxis protein [Treponema ruminis]|uniref:Methyl-accepting chemotaxis protein n=1 Tax=Treponema ruminis TaxID=744515 RepID=A0A7W8LMY8_9SPIR|nr:methyl-accepting chemotaxis protein [Treponema ruminis]MBB5227059.1 methyl-accepting chemotaxis protein [Treponema ruminis]
MKSASKLSILAAALFVAVGLVAVSFGSVLLFRKNARTHLEQMKYTKVLEMEKGLLPERKLAVQLAQSPAVVDYMANPSDEEVRALAFRDFKTFQDSFSSHRTFWISDSDLKYYSNMEFIYDLDKSDPANAWYKATIDANLPFQFYVDYDLGLKKTFMWINVLVYNESRRVTGITGTGVELTDFVQSMYATLEKGITMYMYNSKAEISASTDISDLEKKIPITTTMPELKEVKNLFSNHNVFHSTLHGVYMISPIESLRWQLVLFIPFTVKAFFANALVPFAFFIILAVIILIAYSMHNLFKPLSEVHTTVKNIVSGEADLTRRLNTELHTPFKSIHNIINHFNTFMGKLQEMIGTIKTSSSNLDVVSKNMKESVSSVSDSMTRIRLSIGNVQEQIHNQSQGFNEATDVVREVASSISTVNEMIDSQTKSIRDSSASVGQLVKSIEEISGSMESMASSFNILDREAQSGMAKQQKVNERISQIEEQSQMLQEANMAIASIAEQTNLLAMNAAIEAAHAGEAGKGFAVVADEIRKLSETSSGQSKTIGDQLKNIQDSIGEIVAASQESSTAFSGVSSRIQETDVLVQTVRAALENQNRGSRSVIESLAGMDKTAENVRDASRKMAGGSSHVLEEMDKLRFSLEAVQESMATMSENAQSVVKSGMKLDGCVEELDLNVTQLGSDVGRFKTE